MKAAPTDAEADAVFVDLGRRAAESGLLVFGFSGVMTIMTPAEQRAQGVRGETLRMHQMTEHPDSPVEPVTQGDLFAPEAT